jgi:hypothetical protein
LNILALDLGTSTGYAAGDTDGKHFTMGSWKLATPKEVREWGKQRLTRRRDPRPQRLCDQILKLYYIPDLVVFEDVQFASSTLAVQLWSSLRTGIWMCLGGAVKFDCVPVATLKKFATGAGNATKQDMEAAFAWEPPKGVYSDDAIDAYFIWKWAKQNLSRMKL